MTTTQMIHNKYDLVYTLKIPLISEWIILLLWSTRWSKSENSGRIEPGRLWSFLLCALCHVRALQVDISICLSLFRGFVEEIDFIFESQMGGYFGPERRDGIPGKSWQRFVSSITICGLHSLHFISMITIAFFPFITKKFFFNSLVGHFKSITQRLRQESIWQNTKQYQ